MGIFPDAQGQLTHKSLSNFKPIRDVMVVLVTCKNKEEQIKNEVASGHKIFPIITLWELSVAMETSVLI